MSVRIVMPVIIFGAIVGWTMPGSHSSSRPVLSAAEQAAAMKQATDPALDTVIQRSSDGHFYVNALANDQLIRFVVDTGATTVALTMDDARAMGIPFDPMRFTIVGRGASGAVRGQEVTIPKIAIGQKEAYDVRAVVLDRGLDVSLLGQSYLGQLGEVSINRDRMTLG